MKDRKVFAFQNEQLNRLHQSSTHRIFNALCEQQENRGLVVQQGGTKALLSLALDGTEKGKRCAAQALSRIAITMNPEVAFPGQRVSVWKCLVEGGSVASEYSFVTSRRVSSSSSPLIRGSS